MARNASKATGGYYPTPEVEMAFICRRLTIDEGAHTNIYDPVCGKGQALKQAANHLRKMGAGSVVSYGVELEEGRAGEASRNLDHVVCDGCENIRMSTEKVGFQLLNPPYDYHEGRRMETFFLRMQTRPDGPMAAGSILAYIIPQSSLQDGASLLANRFTNIRVYRFTDRNFFGFNQVVVMGVRRGREEPIDYKEYDETRRMLCSLASCFYQNIPALDMVDGKVYRVPLCEPIQLFKGSQIHPQDFLSVVTESSCWEYFYYLTRPETLDSSVQPIMPLKITQYATLLAAGFVNGAMGAPGNEHIIVGGTREDVETTWSEDDSENLVKKVVTRHVPTIRVYHSNGVTDLK